jgi:hypothetical protein
MTFRAGKLSNNSAVLEKLPKEVGYPKNQESEH